MPESESLQLEQLVHRLLKLFPTADKVEHNVRVRGKSGSLRQVDVLIRQRVGPLDLTIVVDTKYKKKRAKRIDVLTVDDIRSDIGAHLAVVVAPKGFDKGAMAYARTHSVQLLKSVNSNDPAFLGKLVLPLVFEVHLLAYWSDYPFPDYAYPQFDKLLNEWRASASYPKDILKHSYTFEVGITDGGKLIDVATLGMQEIRLFFTKRQPLSFFGLLKDDSREFYTEGFKADLLLHEVLMWPEVKYEEIPPGTAILQLRATRRAEKDGKAVMVGVANHPISLQLAPKNSLIQLGKPTFQAAVGINLNPRRGAELHL